MARTSSNFADPDTSLTGVSGRPLVFSLLLSLRPDQWTKNLFVFAALGFGLKLFDPAAVRTAVEAFLVFCVLSGVVYLVNDVTDRESDRRHPLKRRRPIAAGELPVSSALAAAALLGAAGLA